MAVTYSYNDTFITDSVDISILEAEEEKAIQQVEKINTVGEPYTEMLVVCTVYKALCAMQLEDSGFKDKYDIYSKEFDRYYSLSIQDTPSNIGTIPLGRG